MEHIYKPGDTCLDCQQLGLTHKLRYFYINLTEQIIKCESSNCLFPYNDEVSSDDDDIDQGIEISKQMPACPESVSIDTSELFIKELLNSNAGATSSSEKNTYTDFTEFTITELPGNEPSDCIKEQKPKIEIQSVEYLPLGKSLKIEPMPPQTSSKSTSSTNTNMDIAKAHISRHYNAFEKLKKQRQHCETKKKVKLKSIKHLHHGIVIKKEPTGEQRIIEATQSGSNLSEVLQLMKSKKSAK